MNPKTVDKPQARNFYALLGSTLFFIIISPHVRFVWGEAFVAITFMLILLSTVYALSNNRKVLCIGASLAVPAIILNWIIFFDDIVWIHFFAYLMNIAFLTYAIITFIRSVFFSGKIEVHLVWGALSIYLLIALLWALIYALFDWIQPNSFADLDVHLRGDEIEYLSRKYDILVYYSFVTLTTLGFGDIAPSTPIIKVLSVLEAVSGQFYIAILVASLVGSLMQVKRERED